MGKYCKGLSPRRVDSEAAKAGAKYEPIAKAQLKKVTKLWQQEVSVTFWESIEMREITWEKKNFINERECLRVAKSTERFISLTYAKI